MYSCIVKPAITSGGINGVPALLVRSLQGSRGSTYLMPVYNGRIALGGHLPINTDGVDRSANHPGMRSIFLPIEAPRQLHE